MIIATDIETYKKFDGTKECYDFITNNQPANAEFPFSFGQMEKGKLYPVLNAREYALGVLKTEEGKQKVFYRPQDHWECLMDIYKKAKKKGNKVYVYGHNHNYDFIGYGRDHLFDERLKRVRETPLLFVYDECMYFLDTMSFYRMSLEKVGNLFNKDKLEMPLAVNNPTELVEYCSRDVELTLDSMLYIKESLKEIGYRPKKFLTAGQLAMTTFMTYTRKKNIHWNFMKSGQVYLSPEFRKTRVAYRGARIEAFKTGEFPKATCVDINSAYSKAMYDMEFPNLKDRIFCNKVRLSDWELIRQCIGVMQCTIEADVKKDKVAYLPVRFQKYQVYPKKCRMRGTWTIGEIRKAVELGYKLRSIEWAECYSKNKINPFKDFIKDFYNLKVSNERIRPVAKMLLTNLYGKFAQYSREKEVRNIFRDEVNKYQNEGWEVIGTIDEYYIVEKDIGEYIPKYMNPFFSAKITADTRTIVYDFLRKIPYDDLLYCSTDGITFKGDHISKFKISDNLGDWSVEEKDVPVKIKGEQKYKIGSKVKLSGLPKREQTEKALEQDEIMMSRMVSLKEAISSGNMELLGTFRKMVFENVEKSKADLQIPEYIDETKDYYYIGG